MKTIEVIDLEKLDSSEITVVDVRSSEDYSKGTFNNAISIPKSDFYNNVSKIEKNKPVYVLCYTGDNSVEIVDYLNENGYDAYNIIGGYRAYLRLYLERSLAEDNDTEKITKEIERSIIKKFRKPIWSKFIKALKEYQLINEGDKVAVCISGGKDSMLLAKLIQELQKHGNVKFEAVFLCMNPGYNADNWKIIQENAKLLGIPLTVFESNIFDTVAVIDKNPCYLCARMRRGYLYSHAKELGCNKIALGHHFDDVIETILMSMVYGGQIQTMMPKLHSRNYAGMELIRPLYMVKEADIIRWVEQNDLHFIRCACRFTESYEGSEKKGEVSKRQEMKELIAKFRATNPNIENNIFKSVYNVNLRTVIQYEYKGKKYNFMDTYDDYDPRVQADDDDDEGIE